MSGWTPQRVADLRRMWAEGLSGSQIAVRLGGCTRNAVIGKVHRLKLSPRVTRVRSDLARRARSLARPRPPRQPRLPRQYRGFEFAPLPDTEAKALTNGVHTEDLMINRRPLAELDRADCHWPIGDPRDADFGFCGAAVVAGRPYCKRHAERAYRRAA